MGRWMDLAKRHAEMGPLEPVSSALGPVEIANTTPDQNDQTTKGTNEVVATPLTEFAAQAQGVPKVCFTLRETEDTGTDAMWFQRIRKVIEEHQPGNNRVVMTIFTLDGRKVYAEWRAVASRELRTGIARLLVKRGLVRKKTA